jgi:hypothetical protein
VQRTVGVINVRAQRHRGTEDCSKADFAAVVRAPAHKRRNGHTKQCRVVLTHRLWWWGVLRYTLFSTLPIHTNIKTFS